MRYPHIPLFLLALLAVPVRAQLGDTLGEGPQVPLAAATHFAPDPIYSASEEEKTFKLQPGFKVELVASEPMVHDPVDAAYDVEGNLWVVEFTRFNAGLVKDMPEMAHGVTSVPTSRIVKLVSTHHDGHYDRRIDWLDGLEHTRGIAIVHDGILIADPPYLWLAREAHGTGRCDEKMLVADNYGVPASDEDSGSLLWGRDNILHDISFVYDYNYSHGHAERLPVLMRGQYGVSQDDWGRLFFSRNSDQMRSDLFAPRYNVRNPNATEFPWANVKIAQDQIVWPSHPSPAVNRGYRRGELGESNGGLRDDGTLLEFTAACGSFVYRGRNFPAEFYGNAFVPEPSANLIHRNLLKETRARILAVDAYPKSEFLTSTDTRFRPVNAINTPDGSMLVMDMYRGLLEEYHLVTSYLRDQTIRRGLDKPMFGLGRIWKITYEGEKGPDASVPEAPSGSWSSVAEVPTDQWVRFLAGSSPWWRDTAQQELVERGDRAAVPGLMQLARESGDAAVRVTALWTLDGLQATTPELLNASLKDADSKVRQAAVRLYERFLRGVDQGAALAALGPLVDDPSADVTVQLALSLGEDPSPDVMPVMQQLLAKAGRDSYVPPALATGLGGREIDFIRLAGATQTGGQPPAPLRSLVALLSSSVVHSGDANRIGRLAALAAGEGNLPEWVRIACVGGFDGYTRPAFRRSMAQGALVTSAEVAPLAQSADPAISAPAKRVFAQIQRMEAEAKARAAAARPLTDAEKVLYEEGRATFQICAACHQQTGTGLPNVAPSLVDSHWVVANPELPIRIVLNGKEGTIGFPGAMPPIGGTFSDRQIAGVLTYVRNSWGLQAGAVTTDEVARVRKQVAGRLAAWNNKDLSRVETELGRLEK